MTLPYLGLVPLLGETVSLFRGRGDGVDVVGCYVMVM